MQSLVERLPEVAPPIRKGNPDSYADTPFTDEINLIEMPRKFSFPSIKAYNGTTDLDDYVAQYKHRLLAVALPKGSREATMCKRFGSTLTGPALQWYINLPSRSIASFVVLSDKFVEQFASSRDLEKTSDSLHEILQQRAEPLRGYIARFNQEKVALPECSIPTAISAFKRGMLPDGDLYKELTKYQCKTMEDVISRAWAPNRARREILSKISDNVLRQMGQQDCVALKIEVNELLRKGHLREFLSEKAKSHLSKETTVKPTKAAPVSPPRKDRVIHRMGGRPLNSSPNGKVPYALGHKGDQRGSKIFSLLLSDHSEGKNQDEINLIEMPRKFSFPSIKAYNGTTDLDDYVAQYKHRLLAVALPKGSREATMCKRFGSTLTGPALQWYINLPSRSIASFVVLSDKFVEQFASSRDLEKTSDSLHEILQQRAEPLRGYIARFNQEKVAMPECSIPTAISAFKRGMLPDGDLYKELTKYQRKTMEDVISRAWA
ncbi:hypothetical protein F2Q69_00012949 [Brassica cretica]|uniref:Retrotransposon gag domain-containing protein n=1 Tax=Brassica cretica TaxID=69181 RepID=A0A8S9QZM0_BRACR|nr:hypothetical protein F2Q69_00012949 [Brassica cretica]